MDSKEQKIKSITNVDWYVTLWIQRSKTTRKVARFDNGADFIQWMNGVMLLMMKVVCEIQWINGVMSNWFSVQLDCSFES